MLNIFIDTNIFQHYLQLDDQEGIHKLHDENLSFYESSKIYLLPQVIAEIKEHGLSLSAGLGAKIKINPLDDAFDYIFRLMSDLSDYLVEVSNIYYKVQKSGQLSDNSDLQEQFDICKKILVNGMLYLNSSSLSKGMFLPKISLLEKHISSLGISLEENTDLNPSPNYALGRIIEWTKFGNNEYDAGFTYKDINRTIGNFMFDYKHYKSKETDKARKKTGKDSMVFFQMVFWLNKLRIDIVHDDIIFLTSDYPFVKELHRLMDDITIRGLLENDENYSDLSPTLKSGLVDLATRLRVIKLDIREMYFQNRQGLTSRLLSDVL